MAGHPVLDLVGCYAFSPDKVGRDVGQLCGIEPLGVSATDDVGALLALAPDCVSYMPYRPDFGHLTRILQAGINVVTTMYMLAGTGYGEDATRAVREAALQGGATLYSSGVYPGHAPMVALAASAMCQRIDRISVLESLDVSGYASERMFRAMGFDLEPDDPRAAQAAEASCGSFRDQVTVMAGALGVRLEEIRFTAQFATATRTADLGFMTVGKGRVAAIRGTVAGVAGGRPVIECRFVWRLGQDMTPDWPVTSGYVVEIKGDPGVRLALEAPDGHFDGAVTTAMPCVNAIPAVCAAPPGILNHGDLPLVCGAHLIR
jgi:hypothetical protein